MSIWPWSSGGGRIQDLKAPELASAATTILRKLGRNTLSARLVYRALELNPYDPQALLMLSEIYRGKTRGKRPVGDEIYAGIVLEFATDDKTPLSAEQKRLFDKPRWEVMYLWGFVTPRGKEFDVDHLGYMTFMNELRAKNQTLVHGFQFAMVKLGVSAGILDPAQGSTTRTYQEWLRSDVSALPH